MTERRQLQLHNKLERKLRQFVFNLGYGDGGKIWSVI